MANKHGKKGSEKHQEVQNEERRKAEAEYQKKPVRVETEVPIFTPNS